MSDITKLKEDVDFLMNECLENPKLPNIKRFLKLPNVIKNIIDDYFQIPWYVIHTDKLGKEYSYFQATIPEIKKYFKCFHMSTHLPYNIVYPPKEAFNDTKTKHICWNMIKEVKKAEFLSNHYPRDLTRIHEWGKCALFNMIKKGFTYEQIKNGPYSFNGFIDKGVDIKSIVNIYDE